MNKLLNICLGISYGVWDSIAGMALVFYIDADIHKLNQEKIEERQRRKELRRTPSPVPSCASAMENIQPVVVLKRENPDERNLHTIRKKTDPAMQKASKGESKVARQVLKCCILNGGFTWLSIVFFEQLLLPTLKFVLTICYGEHSEELHYVWGWLHSILSILFGMMWVLPIFFLSKIVSTLWFADIANEAYRVRKGPPQMMSSLSKVIADFLFSLLVQALFLVQSMLVNMIPMHYVGSSLCLLHLCLLYSLYCFEYKWFNMGWELHRRLAYIENNWPYFLGFGLPLTLLTNTSSSVIVSSCIFSIFFPLFILSANEARPIIGTTGTSMRLFSPVVFVSNLFFVRSPRAQQVYKRTRNISPHQQEKFLLHQKTLPRQQSVENKQHLRQQQQVTNEPIRSASSRSPTIRSYSGLRLPLIPIQTHGDPDAKVFSGDTTYSALQR